MTIRSGGDFVVDFMPAKDRWSVVAMGVVMTTVSVLLAIFGGMVGSRYASQRYPDRDVVAGSQRGSHPGERLPTRAN